MVRIGLWVGVLSSHGSVIEVRFDSRIDAKRSRERVMTYAGNGLGR
jgi:hypothetical protein